MKFIASHPPCRNQEVKINSNYCTTIQSKWRFKTPYSCSSKLVTFKSELFCEKICLLTVEIIFDTYNSTKPKFHRLNVGGLNVTQKEDKCFSYLMKGLLFNVIFWYFFNGHRLLSLKFIFFPFQGILRCWFFWSNKLRHDCDNNSFKNRNF